MKRIAKCHCGALSLSAEGEPDPIVMCHCDSCKRRTGTSYNLGAWFPVQDVAVEGETKVYARTGDTNSVLEFYFCPHCGTNLYWKGPEIFPGKIGVAVGCFEDPNFPAPTRSIFGARRHRWLSMPEGVHSLVGGKFSEPE